MRVNVVVPAMVRGMRVNVSKAVPWALGRLFEQKVQKWRFRTSLILRKGSRKRRNNTSMMCRKWLKTRYPDGSVALLRC